MGKILAADKMRMLALHEQGHGTKVIVTAYREMQWKLNSVWPERFTTLTEHSYNETGLLHRWEELLPKPARQQAEQPRLVSRLMQGWCPSWPSACWMRSLHSTWWYRLECVAAECVVVARAGWSVWLECVVVARAGCCSWKRRPNWTLTTILVVCCLNWWQIATVSCPQASSSSKMAPQRTWHA